MDLPPDEDKEIRTLEGEVRVASRIIDYLSSGLYATPGACLKELVNNSYDADAIEVRLNVKPTARTVTLEDDGIGLTAEQFEAHFKKIADSRKRDVTEVTDIHGRKKVGKIGIGFIAANELCDRMRIESTVEGSEELLDVTVDFEAMRSEPAERRAEDGTIHKGDYNGHVVITEPGRHFTRITLFDLKPDAQDVLIRSEPEAMQSARTLKSVYGLGPSSIANLLAELDAWTTLDLYSKTMLEVGLNVPVRYPDRWIAVNTGDLPNDVAKIEAKFTQRAKKSNFTVWYDGTDLRKPIALTANRSSFLLREISHKGKHLNYNGYLFASRGTIKPVELQGVLVRIREAAVGDYSQDLLGFPQSRASLLQRWVSAEIYAGDELEDAMNIDRSTLRETHPAYVELRQSFHAHLDEFLSLVRRELYQEPAAARKEAQAASASKRITERLREPTQAGEGPKPGSSTSKGRSAHEAAARAVEERSSTDPAAFTRRMTTAELYEVVTEVADATLPEDMAGRFLEALAEEIFRRSRRRGN